MFPPIIYASQKPQQVTINKVKILIKQQKRGKALGTDLVPEELFKIDPNWWAQILASVFTGINKTGCIPEVWYTVIMVLIYK